MHTEKKNHYRYVKDQEGTDVYCPVAAEDRAAVDSNAGSDECVEMDVVERYSGNIDIRS